MREREALVHLVSMRLQLTEPNVLLEPKRSAKRLASYKLSRRVSVEAEAEAICGSGSYGASPRGLPSRSP
jgi:hypothetical protein